jgi:hypothetical protein
VPCNMYKQITKINKKICEIENSYNKLSKLKVLTKCCHIFCPFACYQIIERKCLLNLNVILKEIKKLVTFNLPSCKCFSAKDYSTRNKP